MLPALSVNYFLYFHFYFHCRLKTLGCMNLDDLSQFDYQLQLSLAAWGYYYEDYIKLSTGIKILQTSRGSRDQDYEIRLVHSLAERRLNEKWSIGETFIKTFSSVKGLQLRLYATPECCQGSCKCQTNDLKGILLMLNGAMCFHKCFYYKSYRSFESSLKVL